MKYYEFNKKGIIKILGLDTAYLKEDEDIFREGNLYLKENESIKIKDIITNKKDMEFNCSIYEGSEDNSLMKANLTFRHGSGQLLLNIEYIDLKEIKDRTVEEVYKYAKDLVLNKTFSFNKAEELGICLYEGKEYEEITEEEYKKYKVENTFK
ncbi:hypothetical protein PALS2_078 [Staphylococcus phage PALS_2]|nr:hypothetical protein PALS2_078 [Staphylococcus phage PALS_2]